MKRTTWTRWRIQLRPRTITGFVISFRNRRNDPNLLWIYKFTGPLVIFSISSGSRRRSMSDGSGVPYGPVQRRLQFRTGRPPSVALYLNRRLWPFTALNSWTGSLSIDLDSWKGWTRSRGAVDREDCASKGSSNRKAGKHPVLPTASIKKSSTCSKTLTSLQKLPKNLPRSLGFRALKTVRGQNWWAA
jgi:hypothetical protein